MTVNEYFRSRLDHDLVVPINDRDDTHEALQTSINSPCGLYCKAAIDAAVCLMNELVETCGNDFPEYNMSIIKTTRHICNIHIYG